MPMQKKNMGYLQGLLISELEQRRIKNPSFSVRALAKKLDMSHSAISEIINGKRSVSTKVIERIADRLMLDPNERHKLLGSIESVSIESAHSKKALQLTFDQYKIIADWYHFAIILLSQTDNFKSDIPWIASRLGLGEKTVTQAIDRLLRLEFIKRDKAGRLVSTGQSFSTTDGVPNSALRRTHSQNLELAQKSLETDDLEMRDFSAMTMAIDPAKIGEARKRLRKFRDDLCEFLESDTKTEVYKLCLQLFPLTRGRL